MPNPILIKNYIGQTAIPEHRFVKITANDNEVALPGAIGAPVNGATTFVPLETAGGRVDVVHAGIVSVMAGGAIIRGAEVSADAQGKAITKPTTGTPAVAGVALERASAGDIIEVLLS